MEVDNAALSLACLSRVFHGASVEDSSMMARKAIEIAGVGADEVDLLDALDDVWAASILAGTLVIADSLPVHPDDPEDRHPKRYKDANLVARKKKRAKKRRHWDKP